MREYVRIKVLENAGQGCACAWGSDTFYTELEGVWRGCVHCRFINGK